MPINPYESPQEVNEKPGFGWRTPHYGSVVFWSVILVGQSFVLNFFLSAYRDAKLPTNKLYAAGGMGLMAVLGFMTMFYALRAFRWFPPST